MKRVNISELKEGMVVIPDNVVAIAACKNTLYSTFFRDWLAVYPKQGARFLVSNISEPGKREKYAEYGYPSMVYLDCAHLNKSVGIWAHNWWDKKPGLRELMPKQVDMWFQVIAEETLDRADFNPSFLTGGPAHDWWEMEALHRRLDIITRVVIGDGVWTSEDRDRFTAHYKHILQRIYDMTCAMESKKEKV